MMEKKYHSELFASPGHIFFYFYRRDGSPLVVYENPEIACSIVFVWNEWKGKWHADTARQLLQDNAK